jgi:hypothetical protein
MCKITPSNINMLRLWPHSFLLANTNSKTYLSHREYLFLCCVEFYVFDICYTFAKKLISVCDK